MTRITFTTFIIVNLLNTRYLRCFLLIPEISAIGQPWIGRFWGSNEWVIFRVHIIIPHVPIKMKCYFLTRYVIRMMHSYLKAHLVLFTYNSATFEIFMECLSNLYFSDFICCWSSAAVGTFRAWPPLMSNAPQRGRFIRHTFFISISVVLTQPGCMIKDVNLKTKIIWRNMQYKLLIKKLPMVYEHPKTPFLDYLAPFVPVYLFSYLPYSELPPKIEWFINFK